MMRIIILTVVGGALAAPAGAQEQPKKSPEKAMAFLRDLVKSSPDELIAKFDKNGDKQLAVDELPPFLAKGFEKSDRDGNGKLNQEELKQMLEIFRRFAGAGAPKAQEIVQQMLQRMDKDKDGKIAKNEAELRVAQGFDMADRNKDGFLDRSELQVLAERFAQVGGPPGSNFPGGGGGLDFDALDKDANGRVSRQEATASPLARTFAEIDTDGDGQISRREFEAYSRKKD